MNGPEFVHLHNHSDYSLLDGAASVEDLAAKAKSLGMAALALTDHGNMFGIIKFYLECRRLGIKPLVGSEFYLAPESRLKKAGGEKGARYYHLVLLARDRQGYGNLMKLSSLGYTEGFYYKPRIDDELLGAYRQGLVALSGCLGGEIPRLVLEGRQEQARAKAGFYQELFGREGFFLELQDHGIPEQKTINRGLVEIARQIQAPLVATNDIHYVDKADAIHQDILICIGTNKKLSEGGRIKFQYPEFYFKSQEEMARLFSGLPEALANTLRVAEMCDLTIAQPGPKLPHYEVPEGYDLAGYLSLVAHQGLEERFRPAPVPPQYAQRLEYELSVINSMGYMGYFLIVWDFIRFARQNGIPVGPGRGSGAGSLAAYALKITNIDPLKYGLLFERFLNPERISMPDFDIDFCYEGRGQVIDYVIRKYGATRVAQIITFGTLKARAVIRDVARVLDLPYAEADRIAKLVPAGPNMDLATALDLEPELARIAQQGDTYRQLLETSQRLEGLARHASTHAAGIVIAGEDLTEYVPLYRDPKTDSISTQYTMDYLEDCGLVKMDFLGLKTLTLIKNTLELLRGRGIELDLYDIPEEDPATFKLLGEGRSTCIFQFESQGMQEVLRRAKPESIRDLTALNALYRPGPMEFIDQFIDAKRGKKPIVYPLAELEEILKETYGVIVYQEQVMEIARQVAGFSLGQADILRRAMGKKKYSVMEEQKNLFIQGAAQKGHSRGEAEKLFDLLVPFAGYGFNKSHAAAYSLLAYQTAYLKATYPAEFMAANLTNEISSTEKLSEVIGEAREMGLLVLPPDINLSQRDFSVAEGGIVYGLVGIKNVGTAAVEEIIGVRRRVGGFRSFMHFLEQVDLKICNRKVVETLILCGVFDRCGENRATLFHNLERILGILSEAKENRKYGQASLFEDQKEVEPRVPGLEKVEEWSFTDRLRREKENLGFYFSGHPLDGCRKLIRQHVNLDLAKLEEYSQDRSCTLIGVLKELKVINTRAGKRMAFAVLEDFAGSIELVIFSDLYEQAKELLVQDRVLAVMGKIDRSRGEAKLKAERILEPGELAARTPGEIHVRFAGDPGGEENLLRLRNLMVEKPGTCAVYLHLKGGGQQDVVVKASPQLTLSDEEEVLAKIKSCPQVEDVWKE